MEAGGAAARPRPRAARPTFSPGWRQQRAGTARRYSAVLAADEPEPDVRGARADGREPIMPDTERWWRQAPAVTPTRPEKWAASAPNWRHFLPRLSLLSNRNLCRRTRPSIWPSLQVTSEAQRRPAPFRIGTGRAREVSLTQNSAR